MIDLNTLIHNVVYSIAILTLTVAINVLWQLIPRSKSEPPLVFHWIPFVGSAISYGLNPFEFFTKCRKHHGDIFTFILLGKKITVYLGVDGNDFILNGKLRDVNAEDVYGALTTPVFGKDIIYDCPNEKLMEQKKFVKSGLTQKALESYVPLIEQEVLEYMKTSPNFKGTSGIIDITAAMAEVTLFTASRALQGAEVRKKLTAEFAELYHDLDLGFQPINFLMPWAPLPQNRRRDAAHAKMTETYLEIINKRRASKNSGDTSNENSNDGTDMILNLMGSVYKDGQILTDTNIAHLMITLLMAGQHSSSSSSAWIMLRLASRPEIVEELYQEQINNLNYTGQPLQYSDLNKLPLLQNVVKETLRVHSSIHSLMRKVKNPMSIPNTEYVITPDKVLLASPLMTHLNEEHFTNPLVWDPHRWDDIVEVENKEDIVDYGYGAMSKGTRSPYLPFGAGRHRCIGEKFAYLNLVTIVSTLVRNFKFATVDGKSWVPPTDYTSMFSRPVQPAHIRWERRSPESA